MIDPAPKGRRNQSEARYRVFVPAELNSPTCPACGYSLAALPKGACPECGRHFDPFDARTFHWGAPRTAALLATFSPPRWVMAAYVAAATLWTVLMCSPNGMMSDESTGWWVVGHGFTVVVWLIAFTFHLGGRVWLRATGNPQPRWHWRWLIIPALIPAAFALQDSGWLWRARWAEAKGGFTAALPASAGSPWLIGSFTVVNVDRRADGTVWFQIGFPDCYSQGDPEIIYSPGVYPFGGPSVVDLGGGWWVGFNPT